MANLQSLHVHEMEAGNAMADIAASQVLYLFIFVTLNEDLGVLHSVTDMKIPWKLRSEIANKFRSTGKETSSLIRDYTQRWHR